MKLALSVSGATAWELPRFIKAWYEPRMNTSFTLTTFTPGEAERITGLSTAMQRDWRRRDYLPSTEGQARFDVFRLAEMLSLKLLSDRGIGPQAAKDVAPWCAQGIVWHALKWIDSYEGDHLRAVDEADPASTWGQKADWLARQVFRRNGKGGITFRRYFIWWADGTHVFNAALEDAFDGTSGDPRLAGPIVVLDFAALASTILDRAGRPIVHVEVSTESEGDPIPSEAGGNV